MEGSLGYPLRLGKNDTIGISQIPAGWLIRTQYTWKDADEVYLEPAAYHHMGSREQIVRWDSQLTYEFESTGSNSNSEDFAATEWHYLYIDDSELTGPIIDETKLVNNTTAPTWSDSAHAYMNGLDRCIGAFHTTAVPALREFFHIGNLFRYADNILDVSAQDVDDAWEDLSPLTIPTAITVRALITTTESGAVDYSWRTNGQSGTTGSKFIIGSDEAKTSIVVTDSSGIIEAKGGASDATTLSVRTEGYFFGIGI